MTENTLYEPHKSSIFGLDASKAIIILYALASIFMLIPYANALSIVVPIVFLAMEKESEFVRFCAKQTLIYTIALSVLAYVLIIFFMYPMVPDANLQGLNVQYVPMIRVAWVPFLPGIILACLSALAIVKGQSYEAFKFPIAGAMAEKKK